MGTIVRGSKLSNKIPSMDWYTLEFQINHGKIDCTCGKCG